MCPKCDMNQVDSNKNITQWNNLNLLFVDAISNYEGCLMSLNIINQQKCDNKKMKIESTSNMTHILQF